MRKLWLYLLVMGLCAGSVQAKPKPSKEKISSGGRSRTYYLFVPERISSPAPLLLLLHGSGRNGMSQIDAWKSLAEKEGVILVAPDSTNPQEWSFQTDGPEFLHDVVEAVRSKYTVDGKRLYLFGHSAGACFALYMAVMESRYFAAAAVHAGAMDKAFYPYIDHAERKVPLAIWVGTADTYFSLGTVRQTRDALNRRGFNTQMNEMKGHDHDYYGVANALNPKIWDFLHQTSLGDDPEWETYRR